MEVGPANHNFLPMSSDGLNRQFPLPPNRSGAPIGRPVENMSNEVSAENFAKTCERLTFLTYKGG